LSSKFKFKLPHFSFSVKLEADGRLNSCEYIFPIKYIYSNNRSETLPVVSYWAKLV